MSQVRWMAEDTVFFGSIALAFIEALLCFNSIMDGNYWTAIERALVAASIFALIRAHLKG